MTEEEANTIIKVLTDTEKVILLGWLVAIQGMREASASLLE